MKRLLSILAFFVLATAPAQEPAPPVPPLPPSPVEPFRQWLKLSSEGREQALADWPAEKRAVLLRKLEIYSRLPAEESERRLQMLELRHFLRPLMSLPTDQREVAIQSVPDHLRPLVTERVKRWESLSPELQKRVLDHDAAMSYFARVRQPPQLPAPSFQSAPPQPAASNPLVAQWLELPEAERRKLTDQLNSFFELPPQRREKALATLGVAERDEIQRTLDAFARLPSEQKRACIASFQKFASMEPRERSNFLRHAARWQAMSPEERDTWKKLVSSLPPMPPGPRGQGVLPPEPPR